MAGKNTQARKFPIGIRVKNIETGETGTVAAYDMAEVYVVSLDGAGFRLWGELDMEEAA